MRILFLLPSVPEPATSGARLRNRALMQAAARHHDVHAVAFGQPSEAADLRALASHSAIVPAPPHRTAALRARQALGSRRADLLLRLASKSFACCVREHLDARRYDVVQAEGLEMGPYLSPVSVGARVYDAHNAEYLLQARAADSALAGARSPWQLALAAYSRIQAQRLRRAEGALVSRADLTLAVSEHDANQLAALARGRMRVAVVPNVLDLEAFPFQQQACREKALLFLGTLAYRPNVEAVAWIVRDVLPRVWLQEPEVRLFVVGAQPPAWLVRLGQHDDRIAVTGGVPNESPYLARSAVMVLPFASGSGSRLKALVGLASGVPVVSTRLGMAGLDAVPGEHYVRAESAEEWAAACLHLVREPGRTPQQLRVARSLVEQQYSQAAADAALGAAYARLARS